MSLLEYTTDKLSIVYVDRTKEGWEEKWLALRIGIGGSMSGTIAGVNKYDSALNLWEETTGVRPRSFTGNEATEWGHLLEDDVATKYARDYNKAIVEWPVIIYSLDEETSFMFANLDYVEVTPSKKFPAGKVTVWKNTTPPPGIIDIVECKTTGIATHGNAPGWAKNQVPDTYLVQGYHYGMVITSLLPSRHVTFVALIGGEGLAVRKMGTREDDDIIWDDDIAENILIAETQWWDLVQYNIPPEVDGSDITESLIAARFPRSKPDKVLEADDHLLSLFADLAENKIIQAAAEKETKEARNQIVAILEDAEMVMHENVLIATFNTSKDIESFDKDRFAKDHPDLFKEYLKTGPGRRTLLPK